MRQARDALLRRILADIQRVVDEMEVLILESTDSEEHLKLIDEAVHLKFAMHRIRNVLEPYSPDQVHFADPDAMF